MFDTRVRVSEEISRETTGKGMVHLQWRPQPRTRHEHGITSKDRSNYGVELTRDYKSSCVLAMAKET